MITACHAVLGEGIPGQLRTWRSGNGYHTQGPFAAGLGAQGHRTSLSELLILQEIERSSSSWKFVEQQIELYQSLFRAVLLASLFLAPKLPQHFHGIVAVLLKL